MLRSQHMDMSPCALIPGKAQRGEAERIVVTASAGSARCRLRLIDSEPELRPVCFVYTGQEISAMRSMM